MVVSFLALLLSPEDGGDMFHQNIGWLSLVYIALYPGRWNSLYPPLWEHEILHCVDNFIFLFSENVYFILNYPALLISQKHVEEWHLIVFITWVKDMYNINYFVATAYSESLLKCFQATKKYKILKQKEVLKV
jgi:hypothetical protein